MSELTCNTASLLGLLCWNYFFRCQILKCACWPLLTTAWRIYLGPMSGILPSQRPSCSQGIFSNLGWPGCRTCGSSWNKVKLKFVSEAELECGERSSGFRIRKFDSQLLFLSSLSTVVLGIQFLILEKKCNTHIASCCEKYCDAHKPKCRRTLTQI